MRVTPQPRSPDTVESLLASAAALLRDAGVEQPRSEAQLLLADTLNADKSSLLAHPDRAISPPVVSRFADLSARRAAREPLAYIRGEREFYGRPFFVDRRVLIPRPETELLVEEALSVLSRRRVARPLIIDVGTGSGAIACTLALEAPAERVVAADVSADALEVAAENCRRHGLTGRVKLVCGDLLTWLGRRADLVVGNLPYLPGGRIAALQAEVAWFEPVLALAAGPDGADLLRRVLKSAADVVTPGGTLILELDPEQVEPLRALLPWPSRVGRDLGASDRIVRFDAPE